MEPDHEHHIMDIFMHIGENIRSFIPQEDIINALSMEPNPGEEPLENGTMEKLQLKRII